jgi:hypothetical protein
MTHKILSRAIVSSFTIDYNVFKKYNLGIPAFTGLARYRTRRGFVYLKKNVPCRAHHEKSPAGNRQGFEDKLCYATV